MVARLASIIDSLYDQKRRGKALGKKLLFIVGNGVDPVNNVLYDDTLRPLARAKGHRTRRDYEAFKWRHFEMARYYTSNSIPSFAHCCIYMLVRDGLCQDVITTNYDLFFDEIWRRHPRLKVRQNPVLEDGEYCWENFQSAKHGSDRTARYWKVHGSLSHISFRNKVYSDQHVLARLPRFAISANNDGLARAYHISTQAPFLGYEACLYTRTKFTGYQQLEAPFFPFIDWTYKNDRSRFNREIQGAVEIISQPKRLAALIILGFSGYYSAARPDDPWNEELVPAIRELIAGGFPDVYMAVHKLQYNRAEKEPYRLMRELSARGQCYVYEPTSAIFMRDLLENTSGAFPYDYAEDEYEYWRNHWYLTAPEPVHA